MRTTTAAAVQWAPRVLGLLMAAFLALFALDVFEGQSFWRELTGFAVHLIPTYLVLAVVALAWRHEWVGALACFGLAVAYGLMVRWRMDWVAVIAGPLVLIGLLYLVSWSQRVSRRTSGA